MSSCSCFVLFAWALLALPVAGWAAADPSQQTSAAPAVVQEGRHGEILTITEVNWSSYPKIQLERATVEFQKNWVRDQKSRNGYTIRESDLERIRSDMADLLDEVLGQELTKECAYTLVDQGGPGVMRIVNLNIYAPDRVRNHIGYSLSDSQGSMTLELEIHDSESGALLATSRHHQVDPYKGYMEWTTSGTNRRSARLMLKRWASGLCERLEEARAESDHSEDLTVAPPAFPPGARESGPSGSPAAAGRPADP